MVASSPWAILWGMETEAPSRPLIDTPAAIRRRAYMRARVAECKRLCREILGGKCAKCGSVDRLEFDHIDPATKVAPISSMAAQARAAVLKELAKCQLLCKTCHTAKSITDRGLKPAEHGTQIMYTGTGNPNGRKPCRCVPCSTAHRIYERALRVRRGQRVVSLILEHATHTMYRHGCRCYFCVEYVLGTNRVYRQNQAAKAGR